MTKIKQLHIPAFSGFYCTKWDALIENEVDYALYELSKTEGYDPDFVTKNLLPTDEWREATEQLIAESYAESFCDMVHGTLGINIAHSNVTIQSPREYNFANDKLYIDAEIINDTEEFASRLLNLISENRQELAEMVRNSHTSCDGFWSFMSNELSEWEEMIEHHDFDPLYLGYLLAYLLKIKSNNFQDFIFWGVSDMGVGPVEFEASTPKAQEKWEAMQEEVARAKKLLAYQRSLPTIPGII